MAHAELPGGQEGTKLQTSQAIRFFGSIPIESRDFIRPQDLVMFDILHRVPNLRNKTEVYRKLLEFQKIREEALKDVPSEGKLEYLTIAGIWSALRTSLITRTYMLPPELSLIPTQEIISNSSSAMADALLVEGDNQPEHKTLEFLTGRVIGFDWILGREESLPHAV